LCVWGYVAGEGKRGVREVKQGSSKGAHFYLVEELSFSINSAIEFPDVLKNFPFFFF
jgi:hypothetical protein